jgi:hypothetical protein
VTTEGPPSENAASRTGLAATRPLGLIMAFGAGVLISAVSYELVEDAFDAAGGSGAVALGLFAGAFTFYLGDLAIDRFGGEGRKSAAGGKTPVPAWPSCSAPFWTASPSRSCSASRCLEAGG